MNASKVLELIVENKIEEIKTLAELASDPAGQVARKSCRKKKGYNPASNSVCVMFSAITREITQQAIKEKGGSTELKRFKAAQKYIKKIEKRDMSKALAGVWEEQGKQCFTDGFTAFILSNKIEKLPKVKVNKDGFPGNTYREIEVHQYLKHADIDLIEIKVDIADVKSKLKIYKAEHKRSKVPCRYELGICDYNAEHIINCYEILGGNIVFKQPKSEKNLASVLESENGKAILLPIRKLKRKCA